ncbi:MAG TPA: energy transducer TonB [Allosphingosinicella sp.]|nr:energy transducer TonB [Allosphingosinicella sp.]
MLRVNEENRSRIGSATGVAAIHALLGYLLLTGLGFAVPIPGQAELKLIDFLEDPPPPAEPAQPEKVRESQKAKPKDPEGAAAPPNLKDTPTQIVAPPPEIRLPIPPPIPAAPVPGQGNAPAAGAAEIPGPGTGRGGQGTGLGSGSQGTGTGGGGGGLGRGARARHISGSIGPDDYPRGAFERRIAGVVYLRFVVQPDGRVRDCIVTRSSGSAELDRTTCRLIERRFRYRPARNAEGRPIPETIRGEHHWEIGPEPPPIDVEPVEEPRG